MSLFDPLMTEQCLNFDPMTNNAGKQAFPVYFLDITKNGIVSLDDMPVLKQGSFLDWTMRETFLGFKTQICLVFVIYVCLQFYMVGSGVDDRQKWQKNPFFDDDSICGKWLAYRLFRPHCSVSVSLSALFSLHMPNFEKVLGPPFTFSSRLRYADQFFAFFSKIECSA